MRFVSSTMLGFMLKENSSRFNGPTTTRVIPCNNMMNNNNNNVVDMKRKQQVRSMVGKANNRSGVHGTHLPPTNIVDNVEEMEENIKKGKKDIEAKRKEVEEAVDSHLKQHSDRQPKSS